MQITSFQQNNNIIYKNNIKQYETNDNTVSDSNVAFKGYYKRSPMMTTTYNAAKQLYTNYQNSLNEVSLKEIKNSVLNISKDMNIPAKDVLYTMQRLTQFANLRSVSKISEQLKKDKIGSIGDLRGALTLKYSNMHYAVSSERLGKVLNNDIGLHSTLDYLLNKKNIGMMDSYTNLSTAVFLDKSKISQLEKFKKEDRFAFEAYKTIPNVKYYYISGWDNGITFADRTKDLETETRKILKSSKHSNKPTDEIIDAPLLERINKLGIKPTIIENEGLANLSSIYHQMAPERIYPSEMLNFIDVNSDLKLPYDNDLKMAGKDETVHYLQSNLKVYTPENLSLALKKMKVKIDKFVEEKGKTQNNVLYALPDNSKSHCLINYMYGRINNIPYEQFVSTCELNQNKKLGKDKILVLLDDCSLTGNSISTILDNDLKSRTVRNSNSVLFALVCGNKNAKFNETAKKHRIILDEIDGLNTKKASNEMNMLVGKSIYGNNYTYCVSFPYMGPDNNNEIGASIALYHNVNYRIAKHQFDLNEMGVKGITTQVKDIFKHTDKNIGSQPTISDKKVEMQYKTTKTKLDKILDKFGINHQ